MIPGMLVCPRGNWVSVDSQRGVHLGQLEEVVPVCWC